MSSTIERIRASKAKWNSDVNTFGRKDGRRWAEDHAAYEDLTRVSAIDLGKIDPDDETDIFTAIELALDPQRDRPEWTVNVLGIDNGSNLGVPPTERTSQEAYAFVEGVQEFFAEIKGQI